MNEGRAPDAWDKRGQNNMDPAQRHSGLLRDMEVLSGLPYDSFADST